MESEQASVLKLFLASILIEDPSASKEHAYVTCSFMQSFNPTEFSDLFDEVATELIDRQTLKSLAEIGDVGV